MSAVLVASSYQLQLGRHGSPSLADPCDPSRAVRRATSCHSSFVGPPRLCHRFSPVCTLGPLLNTQVYYVGKIENNSLLGARTALYQAGRVSHAGPGFVSARCAPPPTIGHNLQRAIDKSRDRRREQQLTHLIYSHHHADHGGASSRFDKNVVRIGHENAAPAAARQRSSRRRRRRRFKTSGRSISPPPTCAHRARVHGSNHSPDNIFIHLPDPTPSMRDRRVTSVGAVSPSPSHRGRTGYIWAPAIRSH